MKLKSIVVTSVIALGLTMSAQVIVNEAALQRLMGSLISRAVSTTQAEI